MRDWLAMTPADFDDGSEPVELTLFEAPDPMGTAPLFDPETAG